MPSHFGLMQVNYSLAFLALVGLAARLAFIRVAAHSRVDHYYWLMAARAYRQMEQLPARIPAKYLLENEEQAYPPFFGWLLARFSEESLRRLAPYLSTIADSLVLLAIISFLSLQGVSLAGILAAVAVYLLAPVLINYNTQLNSRVFGQLFLVVSLLSQVGATFALTEWGGLALWILATITAALVILTHKMTTQLMLFMWPFWAFYLDSSMGWFIPPLGILLATVVTGPRFALYQWRGHWDIVRFWYRHWRQLGAHQFLHSPIYGDPSRLCESAFHRPGWQGVWQHLRKVIAYAPANLILIAYFLATPMSFPIWLIVWLMATYLFSLLTLFVNPLKCLGGGHYYIFNAVAPGAMGWAYASNLSPSSFMTWFLVALALNIVALYFAWHIVAGRKFGLDHDLQAIIARLRDIPKGNVAVFPLTAAESVAFHTPHAVLWGGHGYGFCRLEGFWPVVDQPLSPFLKKNRIGFIVWNEEYFPKAESVLHAEGMRLKLLAQEGKWRLARIIGGDGGKTDNIKQAH